MKSCDESTFSGSATRGEGAVEDLSPESPTFDKTHHENGIKLAGIPLDSKITSKSSPPPHFCWTFQSWRSHCSNYNLFDAEKDLVLLSFGRIKLFIFEQNALCDAQYWR